MKNLYLACLAAALLPSFVFAQDGEPPTYIAKFTSNPPIIDGVLTSDGEWSPAETADGWSLFRFGATPDLTNNRFEVLWDQDGMFLRHRVDHAGWPAPPIGIGSVQFLYESLSLYLDPNKDGEANANSAPDGYKIAFNQPLGLTQRTPDTPQFEKLGIDEQAHIDNPVGNQHQFAGFSNIEIVQTMSDEEEFGYTEMFVPWEDFNSSDPEVWDPELVDTGLYHPHAPFDGEEWFFNIFRIQTDGATSAWFNSSVAGGGLFAARPHGILRFSEGSTDPGDVNGDGKCDALDIDAVAKAVREESVEEIFDVNVDGLVSWDDHEYMVEVLHNTYFGDSNLDGEFNTSDFVTVFTAGEYEDGLAMNSLWATGDWDGDGDFSTSDFVHVFTKGGYEVGPRMAVLAVPEPSGLLLLVIGLLCLVRHRFKS